MSDIITLTGENGQKLDFTLEAYVEYDSYTYAILKPTSSKLGLEKDEAVVFRLGEDDSLELEFDEDIIAAVEEIYLNDLEA